MNRAERRRLVKDGIPRAEVERRAALDRKIDRLARDATVQVQADTATQRAMWLMVVSIADAYEKMRQAAEKATGTEIKYLYEKDWRKKLKEGKT